MKYDLLIQHGEVVDPGAGLRGMLDVGVSGGKIVAVEPSLAASEAHRTISAKGLLVTAASPPCVTPAAPGRRPSPGCAT